jgi:hypothetical protein
MNHTESIKALNMAIKQKKKKEKVHWFIIQIRLQYCANDYQNTLSKSKILNYDTKLWPIWKCSWKNKWNIKAEFMIDKYNLDLKIMRLIIKESISIYNELRHHYSNYMLTQTNAFTSQIKMRTYKTETLRTFCKCLIKYFCLIICIGYLGQGNIGNKTNFKTYFFNLPFWTLFRGQSTGGVITNQLTIKFDILHKNLFGNYKTKPICCVTRKIV